MARRNTVNDKHAIFKGGATIVGLTIDAHCFACGYDTFLILGAWLVTGKTVGGLRIYPRRNCLDRETALRMWTEKVTWFSNEEGQEGPHRSWPTRRSDRPRSRLFLL